LSRPRFALLRSTLASTEEASLAELSFDEALLTGEHAQKCDPNSGEASVHKQIRMQDATTTHISTALNIMSGTGLFSP
jgi:hypothetical protein